MWMMLILVVFCSDLEICAGKKIQLLVEWRNDWEELIIRGEIVNENEVMVKLFWISCPMQSIKQINKSTL